MRLLRRLLTGSEPNADLGPGAASTGPIHAHRCHAGTARTATVHAGRPVVDEALTGGRTPTRGRRWWMLLPVLLIAVPVAGGPGQTPTIRIGDPPVSIEIVRCHFDEGRIVLRTGDALHVLHPGDTMPGTELDVLEIAEGSATLAVRGAGASPALRLVKVTIDDDGALRLREFSTDPRTLASAEAPSSVNKREPPSVPTGSRPDPEGG